MIISIIAFCVFDLMAFREWIEWPRRLGHHGNFSLLKINTHISVGMLVSALVAFFMGVKHR